LTVKNLILLTNDDGINSPGLRAVAEAVQDLGDVLIVAPRQQQSSMGRAFLGDGTSRARKYMVNRKRVPAYAVTTSPAPTVRHAILLIAERQPTLVISGINYGENLGNGVTISGTIGAALEAANLGVPALAVSLATSIEYHLSYSKEIDFSIPARVVRKFARMILARGMPRGADVLNINVPKGARPNVGWRWTRVSRASYFHSTIKKTPRGKKITGYDVKVDFETLEDDSDIAAVLMDGIVSVSPLTLDMTARVPRSELAQWAKQK
jgi:5'-nucleotidase